MCGAHRKRPAVGAYITGGEAQLSRCEYIGIELVGFTFAATELFAGLDLVAMDIAFILAVEIGVCHW